MQYTRGGGVPTTEWLFLSWYNFTQSPMDLGDVTAGTSHTVVEPLRLAWAPSDQARALLPRITRIFRTIRSTDDWQRRIDAIYRQTAEARRKAQAERDAESDRRTRDFIDQIIWEGQGAGCGGAGAVGSGGGGIPATGSGDPVADTEAEDGAEKADFRGDPVEKTDFWGDPIKDQD